MNTIDWFPSRVPCLPEKESTIGIHPLQITRCARIVAWGRVSPTHSFAAKMSLTD